MQQTFSSHLKELEEKLSKLNLDSIKCRLMHEGSGCGFTRRDADRADLMYRRFLYLNARYPDKMLVPGRLIEAFWHQHIIDTQKYVQDCHHLFGYFLHHFPYLGLRGSEDEQLYKAALNETQNLFIEEFGEGTTQDNPVADYLTEFRNASRQILKFSKNINDTDRPHLPGAFTPVNIHLPMSLVG